MDRPKKEPIPLNQRQDFKICLNCGLPNRNTDPRCMYCQASLKEDTGLFSWLRQTYYVLRWKWDLKQKQETFPQASKPVYAMHSLKAVGFFVLGAVLSGVGLYLFIYSVANSSFSNCIISLLFLGYGIFTLKTLFYQR